MSRLTLVFAVTMSLVFAGCKRAESPRPEEQNPNRNQVEKQKQNQKTDAPQVVKPDQPPVVGERSVADADRDELIQCLGHEDLPVRQEASDRLVAQGPDAVPLLIEALDSDNYHVRAGAVFTLSRFGTEAKSASTKLEELAEEDEWEAVRHAARFALHSINSE